MSKFDFTETMEIIKDSYEKDQDRASQFGLGHSLESVSENPKDHVVLPNWWKDSFGIHGIPFGKLVQISGRSDSGKTTLSLIAMKAAQEQGYGVIYCETEQKTSPQDLEAYGIDPKGVLTINTTITEELFDNIQSGLDVFFNKYPEEKLLLVIDSFGNTTSLRDSELELTTDNSKPGGKGSVNRLGLGQIKLKQRKYPIAVLLVNYSYSNFGSHGETNSGGNALYLWSMLIINAARAGWYNKKVNGQDVRAGVDVVWKTTKNHFSKALKDADGNQLLLPTQIKLRISGEGVKVLDTNKGKKIEFEVAEDA